MIDTNIFNPPNPDIPKSWKLGTVITADNTSSPGKATVKFSGESSATSKYYQCLGSYTPATDDRVILAWFSGTGIILGNY